MGDEMSYPVHDSLAVYDGVDIYNTGDWWKAAIRYGYGEDDSTVAIYLWHYDGDGWKRKNKYNIKTAEAWAMDKSLIESYLGMEVSEATSPPDFPVSDYYHVAAGETVFTTEEWKKGIVVVDEKGDYETHEVMVYLWQNVDGEWRRRQKYTIKSVEDWERDKEAIEEVMSGSTPSELTVPETQHSDDANFESSDSPIAKIASELGIDVSDDDTFHRELKKVHVATSTGD